MSSTSNSFIKLLLINLVGMLLACDGSETRRTGYIEEGKSLFKAGEYKKAQVAFNKAAAVEPENTGSRYQIAEELSKLGDIQDALDQYQIIVKQDSEHLNSRVKLGQLYLLMSKTDEAEKMAKEALALDGENSAALVLMGGVLSAQNNSDAAFVKAEQALQKKPDDIPAILLLASLNAKTGRLDKAIGLLQHNIDKYPENIAQRLLLANLYLQTKALPKARDSLESIIKIEPKQLIHRKRLAMFLIESNQLDSAESVLRTAVTDLPEDGQAKLILVEFLATKRTPEVAIAELIPMIDEQPDNYELRFKLADLQLGQKQPDDVEETLKDVVELAKEGQQADRARNKLARLYLATQRSGQAKTLVKEILANNPEDVDALVLRGEIALADNRVAEAITVLRAVLSGQPDNIKALKLLSAAHLLNKNPVLARENLEKILAIAHKDEIARLDLVNLLVQTGDVQQAERHLSALFKLNPNSKNGLEALFKIYLAQQQWAQAQQVAKQLENNFPDEATGYYLSGLAYQAEGKFDKSIPRFTLALQKQPQSVEPLNQLINSYLQLKQSDKALNKLNEIVKAQPSHFFAYNLMGGVYTHAKKLNDAAVAFQKAIAIKPEWTKPYRNLALIDRLQKKPAEAVKVLTTGIKNTKNSAELINDLAQIYHENGEHDKVIALYEEVYKQNPDSLSAINSLASYMTAYAKDSASLKRLAQLAEPLAQSNDPYLLDTAAWVAYKQDNYEKAKQILLKVHALKPDIAASNYHLGMAYLKLGDKPQAKDYLQKAIDSKANFNGLNEAKERLKTLAAN
ncbi:MAG: tetratricopeptide repeat protein [Methylovulum sp.]|nr:tetratricopeptide repeat protein [Methylovulum sp.]